MKGRRRRGLAAGEILKIAAIAVVLGVLIPGGLLLIRRQETRVDRAPERAGAVLLPAEQERSLVRYNGGWYAKKPGLETVLLLGVDKYEDPQRTGVQGEYEQADFLLLLVIDKAGGTYTEIPLDRDTMTPIALLTDAGARTRTVVRQLTLAHSYGGTERLRCENTAAAVSNLLLGTEIDHCLSLKMDGVGLLADLAGGVELEVLDDLSSLDPTLTRGATVRLRGDQALRYIRARQGLEDATNRRRMERQRQFLQAFQESFREQAAEDGSLVPRLLTELDEYLYSDCGAEQLAGLVNSLAELERQETLPLEGETLQNGKYLEFYPDHEALMALVLDVFYERLV